MKRQNHTTTKQNFSSALLVSFLLTLLIFIIGILLNYSLDFYRIHEIQNVLLYYEIDTAAYRVEQAFVEQTNGSVCNALDRRIYDLKAEIHRIGADLATYSSFSWFKKKDYD